MTVYATHFQHLNMAIWKMGNNSQCFHPFSTQDRANLCLLNVEQNLLIRILIFSISGNLNSKIWSNRVQSRSPTCTGAYRAWETGLRGVFRVYLKGRYGPNSTSPFLNLKKLDKNWNKHTHHQLKKWKCEIWIIFPCFLLGFSPEHLKLTVGGWVEVLSLFCPHCST